MRVSFISLLLFPILIFSQTESSTKAFDSIFYHVAVNVSSSNPSKAMHMADSLYTNSITKKQRIKSLMLKADILEKQEKRGEAIKQALNALKLAEEDKDYSFQSRIYGFLSTQYRTIGFLDKGKESLQKGVSISEKIENNNQTLKYIAMANQEMGEYALEENKYKEAIEFLRKAILSYEMEDNEQFKYFVIGNSEEMLGRANMGLDNKEKALEHYEKANLLINKAGAGNTLWAGLIYNGLATVYIERSSLDSAEVYVTKALKIAEAGKNESLKQEVYKTASELYSQKKLTDSFTLYDSKFNKILIKNNAEKKAMVNRAYRILNEKPKENGNNTLYYVGSLLVLMILLLSAGLFYKRKKLLKAPVNVSSIKTDHEKSVVLVLPEKIENEILEKLKEFEASRDFLNKDMSLAILIGQTKTNIKYLRKVLKKHKQTDYNNYITELRINYIVNKLKTNPEYLNYKISYLADESGFSSHSKFSADFKRVVNSSPSEFIESLRS